MTIDDVSDRLRALGLRIRGAPKRAIELSDDPTPDEIRAAGAARIVQSTVGVPITGGAIDQVIKKLDRLAGKIAPDTVRLTLAPGFAGTDVALKRQGKWTTTRAPADPYSPRHFVAALEPIFAKARSDWRLVIASADEVSKRHASYVLLRREHVDALRDLAFVYP